MVHSRVPISLAMRPDDRNITGRVERAEIASIATRWVESVDSQPFQHTAADLKRERSQPPVAAAGSDSRQDGSAEAEHAPQQGIEIGRLGCFEPVFRQPGGSPPVRPRPARHFRVFLTWVDASVEEIHSVIARLLQVMMLNGRGGRLTGAGGDSNRKANCWTRARCVQVSARNRGTRRRTDPLDNSTGGGGIRRTAGARSGRESRR